MVRPNSSSAKKAKPNNKKSSPAKKANDRSKSAESETGEQETARPAKSNIPSLTSLLASSIRDRTFLRLVLSQPRGKDENSLIKVTVRLIEVKGETRYQWAARTHTQEKHENLTADELVNQSKTVFGVNFSDAHLFTTEADLTIRWNHGRPQRIKRKPPTQRPTEGAGHNREKQYLIPAGVPCPFLIEVGIMLPTGQVRPAMYHKFRQINRYLEFVEDLFDSLPKKGSLQIVDFGCGKSYLTFALHHLLTKIHGREVKIVGLDVKKEVIEECTRIAESLECTGLEFRIGRIEEFQTTERVNLAVSLHACDTATDDALAAAIRWGCEAILAVPCCQHEVCQSLGRQTLPGLTEYGILKERFASLATDALRAQFLELRGYKTQVLEFIETEHTPKNLLIRAVKRTEPIDLAKHQQEYDQLKEVLGITEWHLEKAATVTQ